MFGPLHTFALAVMLMALSLPSQARAQSAPAAPGRIAIGFNTGVLIGPDYGVFALGPNLTINSSRKSAVQVSSSVTRKRDSYSTETDVVYAVQYRRTFRDQGKSRSYWTVGGAGFIEFDRWGERQSLYDGTVRPAHTYSHFFPPLAPVLGIGTEKFIAPRLALRADVVASFLVARAAVGVAVPLGHLR